MYNNNINSCDLLFLSNKEVYNKLLENNDKEYINIKNDVIKYKKEIKSKINKLLENYLDNNNNLLKSRNDSEKYKHNFYNFLLSLIENIKYQELKRSISKDLSGVKNEFKLNMEDISMNMLLIDKNLAEENNNNKKICNLDDFVNRKNSKAKIKILPKKR
tara:strand:+ start:746 stop:1225 length:480 start_codon:yes stop_codon:yes gene_type:complete